MPELSELDRAEACLAEAQDLHEQVRLNLADAHRSREWANGAIWRARKLVDQAGKILGVALIVFVIGAVMLGIGITIAQRAPTTHTRRICAGGDCATLEIPDGQCASARGVTVCVPDSSSRKVSP